MMLVDFLHPDISIRIADAIRWVALLHGSLYATLVLGIILAQKKQVHLGYKAIHMIKYERALLASYLMITSYATFATFEALHTPFVLWKTPLLILAFVFGDISLYHLYLHKDDNRE